MFDELAGIEISQALNTSNQMEIASKDVQNNTDFLARIH